MFQDIGKLSEIRYEFLSRALGAINIVIARPISGLVAE
jgi:uncharacterized membrane protein